MPAAKRSAGCAPDPPAINRPGLLRHHPGPHDEWTCSLRPFCWRRLGDAIQISVPPTSIHARISDTERLRSGRRRRHGAHHAPGAETGSPLSQPVEQQQRYLLQDRPATVFPGFRARRGRTHTPTVPADWVRTRWMSMDEPRSGGPHHFCLRTSSSGRWAHHRSSRPHLRQIGSPAGGHPAAPRSSCRTPALVALKAWVTACSTSCRSRIPGLGTQRLLLVDRVRERSALPGVQNRSGRCCSLRWRSGSTSISPPHPRDASELLGWPRQDRRRAVST